MGSLEADGHMIYFKIDYLDRDLSMHSADPRLQYQWFVAYLLAASEKILTVAGGDEEWISAIKLNIGYHREYLSDKHTFRDQQFNCYSSELRDLITEETGRKAR